MKTKRKVCGVGINDSPTPINKRVTLPHPKGKQIQKTVWACPFYVVWADMLKRCYSPKYLAKYPTYEGCTVCDDWLYFSKFRAWMETQNWEGKELDKDFIKMGNKVYCPEFCLFLSKQMNYLFLTKANQRGETLLGTRRTKSGKYQVSCSTSNKVRHYGTHVCEMYAHNIWKKVKLDHLKELAVSETDERIIAGIRQRVSLLEDSINNNTRVEYL